MFVTSPISRAELPADVELLMTQARERARRRRHRVVLVVAAAVALVIAAVAGAIVTSLSHVPGAAPPRSVSVPALRLVVVTGYIAACAPEYQPPAEPSQGGVIEVLRGQARSGPVIAGSREFTLPAAIAATERIPPGQRFSFRLVPGRYVLLARFSHDSQSPLLVERGGRIVVEPSNHAGPVIQFINVSVRSGSNPVLVIPSGCL